VGVGLRQKIAGMKNSHTSITAEVIDIEGENGRDSMCNSESYEMGIVNFRAGNRVLKNQPLPFPEHFCRMGQQMKHFFNPSRNSLHVNWKEAKPISFQRPRCHAPTLNNVLRDYTQPMPLVPKSLQCGACFLVLSVESVDAPDKDICICENIHLSCFIVRSVDALTAQGFVRKARHRWQRSEYLVECGVGFLRR
jgi:hypothetical protein